MSLTNDSLNKSALARINADADTVHLYNRGGGVRIGIVSRGLALHTAYKDQIKGGWDFVNDQAVDGTTNGDNGTATAGLIAGNGIPFKASVTNGPNDISILGVAPEAYLYDLKVVDPGGATTSTRVADAINWAVTNNLDVLALQVGFTTDHQNISDAVDAAHSAGITMIAPVGSGYATYTNVNVEYPYAIPSAYPAKYDKVIGVAEINHVDSGGWKDRPDYWKKVWDINVQVFRTYRVYHGRDGAVDVVAPGGNTASLAGSVGSTYGTDSTTLRTGTYVAAALVTGLVALIIKGTWATTPDAVKQRLKDAATALTSPGLGPTYNQAIYGSGLVNAVVAAPPPMLAPINLSISEIKTLLGVDSTGLADTTLMAQYADVTLKNIEEVFYKPPDSTDLVAPVDAALIERIVEDLQTVLRADPYPYLRRFPYPNDGATNIPIHDPVRFVIRSDTVGVDINSVKVDIDGTVYQKGDSEFSYTGDRMEYQIEVRPPAWGYEQVVNVTIEAWDLLGKPGLVLERALT